MNAMYVFGEHIEDTLLTEAFAAVPEDFDVDDLAAALRTRGVENSYPCARRFLQKLRRRSKVIKYGAAKGHGARWRKSPTRYAIAE